MLFTSRSKPVGDIASIGGKLPDLTAALKESGPVSLAPGLTLDRSKRTTTLTWEHRNPSGNVSRVQFEIVGDKKAGLDESQVLSSAVELYEKDCTRARASNPVITAFFKGLSASPGIRLLNLENCRVQRGAIVWKTPCNEVRLGKLELEGCQIELQATSFEALDVKFGAESVIRLQADKSRLQGVVVSVDCVMSGSLGKGTIEADCFFHSKHAAALDFRGIKWLEDNKTAPLMARLDDFVFCYGLVSEAFRKQVRASDLTEEEVEALRKKAARQLDQGWG